MAVTTVKTNLIPGTDEKSVDYQWARLSHQVFVRTVGNIMLLCPILHSMGVNCWCLCLPCKWCSSSSPMWWMGLFSVVADSFQRLEGERVCACILLVGYNHYATIKLDECTDSCFHGHSYWVHIIGTLIHYNGYTTGGVEGKYEMRPCFSFDHKCTSPSSRSNMLI